MNTWGNIFRFTDFGESHGKVVGGVIDGCPAGLDIDMKAIRQDLNRRAGRDSAYPISKRAQTEPDEVEFLSGIKDGITLGTPVAFIIRNTDAHAEDYEALQDIFRPAHADFTYLKKYGIRDWRGGGRASARETAARVVAGSIAKQILAKKGISVSVDAIQIGTETEHERIIALLQTIQEQGDSIGGIVECRIMGLPIGIGEPIFDKLQARLAFAVMSINACKGFDYGSGFEGIDKKGSELNTYSGGALGGISDGTEFRFRCVFKPTPSIARPQQAQTATGETTEINITGRHDVCVALRAPVIVEAMAAMTVLDMLMLNYSTNLLTN